MCDVYAYVSYVYISCMCICIQCACVCVYIYNTSYYRYSCAEACIINSIEGAPRATNCFISHGQVHSVRIAQGLGGQIHRRGMRRSVFAWLLGSLPINWACPGMICQIVVACSVV